MQASAAKAIHAPIARTERTASLTQELAATRAALASLEERFRLASNATRDLIYDWDLSTGQIEWSKILKEAFGYSIEKLGTSYEWWLSHVHQEDRVRVSEDVASALRRGSERLHSEYRFRRADESFAEVVDRGFAVTDEQGQAVRMVGAMQDVTAHNQAIRQLRQSEHDLSTVCAQATVGILHRRLDGRLIMVNQRFCEILGRTADELKELDVAAFTHPEDLIWNEPAQYSKIWKGHPLSIEKRYVRPDGEIVWCEVSVSRVEPHDGRPGSVIVVAQDITKRKRAEEALHKSGQRLRLVQEASGLAEFESDSDGRCTCSERFFQQLGLPVISESIALTDWFDRIHPDDRERVDADIKRSISSGDQLFEAEFRVVRADTGEVRWIACRTKMERDASGALVRTIGAHLDITDRKNSEHALRESEERFRLAAEAAGFGVWDHDEITDKRSWSPRLKRIFGFPMDEEPHEEAARECIHPADRARFLSEFVAFEKSSESEGYETLFRIIRADDGQERWVRVNGWKSARSAGSRRTIVTIRDVTDERTSEERIRWNAEHDSLTGLANRSLFQDDLDRAIKAGVRCACPVGLLLLDIDHFKEINDTLGHDVGDKLLQIFAKRLRGSVRSGDTVARLGGDEFAVVLPGLSCASELAQVASSILEQMREPYVEDGRILDCRTSIGASLYPSHGKTPEELLKNADIALYAAKSSGRSRTAVFEQKLGAAVRRRQDMLRLARQAVQTEQIVPFYQPKLDLRTGAPIGFEVLLRWRDANGRIRRPATIQAAFEDLELAEAISNQIVDQAIADMRHWTDKGISFGHVAINASAAEFRRDAFAERVLERLELARVSPSGLQLEVTETVFLGRGAEYVRRALALLSAAGVKIALDDFGTGFASLRHLKEFPVDIIKIDRSFVRDMQKDASNEAIVRAVINLGKSLDISVVAEGIETPSQVDQLTRLGCDVGQGFHFSRAVPAPKVPLVLDFLNAKRSRAAA